MNGFFASNLCPQCGMMFDTRVERDEHMESGECEGETPPETDDSAESENAMDQATASLKRR